MAGAVSLTQLCYDNCNVCAGRSQAGWRETSEGRGEITPNVYELTRGAGRARRSPMPNSYSVQTTPSTMRYPPGD